MDSWRRTRRFSLLPAVAVLAFGVLAPTAVQAAGTEVVSRPPTASTAAAEAPAETPSAKPAEPIEAPVVEETKVPAVVTTQEAPEPTESTQAPTPDEVVAELGKTATGDFRLVGVTWDAGPTTGVSVEVRTRTAGVWSDWTELEVEGDDGDEGPDSIPGTEPLWVGDADGVAARVTSTTGVPENVRISTIDPGAGAVATASPMADTTPTTFDGVARATTAGVDGAPAYTGAPNLIRRATWGASSPTKCDTPTVGSTTRGVVVHHTAGSNSYSQADSAALVRGVQSYHMKSRNWCDIGYNFLVDQYGQIFEGRAGGMDRAVRAAHSGNADVNLFTMGVSMMGNYDTAVPSDALKSAMVQLIGWRMGSTFMPVKGTYSLGGKTLNYIAGHRDVVSTACPGRYGYAWLSEAGGLRDRVAEYVSAYNTPIKTLATALGAAATGPVYIGENNRNGGRWAGFANLDIYWSPATGPHYVNGAFRTEYNRLGNANGALGYPVAESVATPTGARQQFTGGVITVSGATVATTFSTYVASPPPAVTALSGSTTKTAGTVRWAASPGATHYGVCLKTSETAATCDRWIGNVKATSATATGLTKRDGRDYWVSVLAYNAAGFSRSGQISLELVPSGPAVPPAVTGLKGSTTRTSGTVSWKKATRATHYGVCFKTSETAASCARWIGNVKGTKVTAKGLTKRDGRDYWVSVLAYNASGFSRSGRISLELVSSSASTASTAVYRLEPTAVTAVADAVPAVPPAVTNLAGSTTRTSGTVRWGAAPGATHYGVCFKTSETATTCSRWIGNVTGTSATATGLTKRAGRDYWVSVLAYNAHGFSRSGQISLELVPSGPAIPPVISGLKGSTTTSTGTVSWKKAARATSYGVCFKTSETAPTCDRWVGKLKKTSVTVSGLTGREGRDYWVSVLAYNGSGFSRSGQISLELVPKLPPPVVTGLVGSTTRTSGTVRWAASRSATHYGVCFKTSETAASCARWIGNVKGTSATATGLSGRDGRDYWVSVLAYNANGFSRSGQISLELVPSATTDSVVITGSRTVSLSGHGYGHGAGMSQWGAQVAAGLGRTAGQILAFYYPGTTIGNRVGDIRVLVTADSSDSVVVRTAPSLTFRRDGDSFVLPTLAGVTQWQIVPVPGAPTTSMLQSKANGVWSSYGGPWSGSAQFERPGAAEITLLLPDSSEVRYRGVLQAAVPSASPATRDTVNIVSIEDYTKGVVAAEMPSSWKAEALKAQSIAARTYGVRSIRATSHYDICDTTSCQVYRGVGAETVATNQAIAATSGQVMTFGGEPAFTQFSASNGGWTAAGSFSYLPAQADPWDGSASNGARDWSTVVPVATLEKAYPSVGSIVRLTVTARNGNGDWGGRVTSLSIVGTAGSVTIGGNTVRSVLGLRSTWFRFV